MSDKVYTSQVLEILENGDALIEIPPDLMEEMGWKEGDEVDISVDDKGQIFLAKK